ncbi:hypothetical protein CMV_010622 [Castanea mollissima]|uniref:Uncharacterized protein n=1 Tax=Castanea mollissima TaxID=60419 RepID=A0A8J4RMN2_9ROSI|nr:hypothetical protein CMV_010622 [Castanea mollissima]
MRSSSTCQSNLDTKKRCYKTNGVGDPQLSPIKQSSKQIRIRFENGRIGPEWRRRGGYGICNRKRGTRSAWTVRRRIRNGRRCRTACSCA